MDLLDQLTADQAERDAEAMRRRLQRMVSYVVSVDESAPDHGWLDSTRALAVDLAEMTGAGSWEAIAAERRWVTATSGQEYHQFITLGDTLRIMITHLIPAGTIRDRWSIAVNGVLIPHRPYRGEVPHTRAALARSVYLHLNGVPAEPCDALTCTDPPTHTLLNRAAYCAEHVDLYA